MYDRDPFDVCDEDTAPDYNAEWRAQAWEAVDEGKVSAADVASAEEVRAYSSHLMRQR